LNNARNYSSVDTPEGEVTSGSSSAASSSHGLFVSSCSTSSWNPVSSRGGSDEDEEWWSNSGQEDEEQNASEEKHYQDAKEQDDEEVVCPLIEMHQEKNLFEAETPSRCRWIKVSISLIIWLSSYLAMGYLGGSVAYLHFPRTASPSPVRLPDFGYSLIPEYCPLIQYGFGFAHSENVQSFILLLLYAGLGVIMCMQARPFLVLQQLLHLNALVFLTRTTTVGLTGLPQPNPRCVDVQHFSISYKQAVHFVMGRGFPPHACGDLIYSGHVACILTCVVLFHRYPPSRARLLYFCLALVWALALAGVYFVISCRSHYTVDVVLAFYFTYFLQDWYFVRSQATTFNKWSCTAVIQWLET